LLDWTGQRWMIGIASGKGEMTVSERDALKRDKLLADAREEPVVKAILDKFYGAEITDVRENRLAGDGPEIPQITDETKGVARS